MAPLRPLVYSSKPCLDCALKLRGKFSSRCTRRSQILGRDKQFSIMWMSPSAIFDIPQTSRTLRRRWGMKKCGESFWLSDDIKKECIAVELDGSEEGDCSERMGIKSSIKVFSFSLPERFLSSPSSLMETFRATRKKRANTRWMNLERYTPRYTGT